MNYWMISYYIKDPNLSHNFGDRSLSEILKADIKLSSTFHPQTNGQTKRVN